MTEYQRLEKELLSLGWKAEQGRGDHMKFSKEGVSQIITIARSLGSGRPFQNTCASIRKLEPGFMLGRPAQKAGADDNPQPGAEVEPEHSWAAEGKQVRFTGPEGRDWEMLKNPDSVMNIPYMVMSYEKTDSGDTKVEISDGENSFKVDISDIDAWELKECGKCGKQLPVNRMTVSQEYGLVCGMCALEIITEKRRSEQEEAGSISIEDTVPQVELPQEAKSVLEKYSSIPLVELPPEKRRLLIEEARKKIDALPAKHRKALKRASPAFFLEIEKMEAEWKPAKTPYEAWRWLMAQLVKRRALSDGIRTKAGVKALETRFFGTSYRTYVLKDKERKDRVMVLEVIAKDWDIAADIYRYKEVTLSTFSFLGEEAGLPVCLLLINAKTGLRQYLTSCWDKRGDEAMEALREAVPEKDRGDCLRKAQSDLAGKKADDCVRTISDWINKNVPEIKVGPKSELLIEVCCGLRLEDEEKFERAMPFWEIHLHLDDVKAGPDTLQKLLGVLSDDSLKGLPIAVDVTPVSGEKHGPVDRAEFFPAGYFDMVPVFDDDKDQTLLRIYIEDGEIVADCPYQLRDEQKEDYLADIVEGVRLIADHCPLAMDGIIRGVNELFPGKGTNCETKTNNNMDDNEKALSATPEKRRADYLDFPNPSSGNEAAGKLTTRELLKELKDRGYAWDHLYRTIIQPVIDDEL